MSGRWTPLPFLLLLLLASGCTDPLSRSCHAPPVPAATEGSTFVYAANGTFSSLSAEAPLVGQTFLAAGDPQAFLVPGSRVTVAIGHSAPRISAATDAEPAIQATTWLEQPGSAALPFLDEWVDAQSGEAVQVANRYILAGPDAQHTMHQIRFTREGRPALLMAPLFWEGADTGDGGRHTYPAERVSPTSPLTTGGFEVSAHSRERGGECLTLAHIVVSYPPRGAVEFPKGDYQLTFKPGIPLPSEAEFHFKTDQSTITMRLELLTWSAGGGLPLPPFRPPPAPPPVQREVAPAGDGLLPGESSQFTTGFAQALEAARQDMASKDWFNGHPGAQPFNAVHVVGAPGSGIADQWTFRLTGNGAAREFTVAHLEAGPTVLRGVNDYRVTSQDTQPPAAALAQARVSWAALERLHQAAYGSSMEVLRVDLEEGSVAIGTHEATDMPRAGGVSGSAYIHPGLLLAVGDGTLLQEDSLVDTPLGPPVPR